jgi:putative FmdB family regulatory protein
MPTYEYACTSCGEHLEIVQSFRDDPLTECPACGGPLRKVFGSVGVVFKGSGFYKTDSRPAGAKSTASGTDAGSSSSKSTAAGDSGAGSSSSTAGTSSNGSGASSSSSGTGSAAAAAS